MSAGRRGAARRHPAVLAWALAHQNATTGILLGLMAVLTGISVAVGAWLTRDGEMLSDSATALLVTTPFVLPIAIAAFMGGLAVHPRGWIPALGLSAGLWLGMIGQATERDALFQTGVALCGAGVVGFWVAGWIARVPMWLGLGRWKWVQVQRTEDDPLAPRDQA
ncbi:hypothetical protein [Nocardioides pantholopis]|uniref:hypothetical protein n=1 Tax=Nocardioides pantholopis TaxID=2483798 RepID=UPI000FD717ED|nr:hypothetical protein [Nocardioides pantholopis]